MREQQPASPATSPPFSEGEIVHLRVRVIEDGGSAVRVLCEQAGLRQTFWAPRASIVRQDTG